MTYQTENLVAVPETNFADFPETDSIDSDNEYDIETDEPMITDQELDFYREERYQQSLVSGKAVWMYAPHPINTNSKRWDMGTLDFSKATFDTPVVVEYNDFPKFSKKLLDRMVREKEELLTTYAAIKATDDKKIRDDAAILKAHAKKIKDNLFERKKKAGLILEKQKAVAVKALDEALAQKRKAAQEKRKQTKIDEEAANKKRFEIISKMPVVEPVPIVEELDEVAQQERQEIDAFIAKVKSMPTFTELVPEVKPVPVVVAPKVEPAPPAPKPAPAPAPAPKPVEVWQEVKKPVAKKPIAKPVEHSAPPPRQTTGKTKLCKSVADKDGKMLPKAQHLRCHHKVCMFAHSFNEIDVLLCRYGSRCRDKQSCRGCHPEETKEKWIQRTMC
jgi:hypothetical protein